MSTIVDLFKQNAKLNPLAKALFFHSPTFDQSLSWQEVWQSALSLSYLMKEMNLLPGDRIGILSPASWRWEVTQLAAFMCRLVVVGLDPHDQVESYRHICELTKLKALFIGNEALKKKFNGLSEELKIPMLEMDFTTASLFAAWGDEEVLSPEDPAILIFTSGTTSLPKGIQYSHGQLYLAVLSILRTLKEIPQGSTAICWLPMSNLFQRIVNFCCVGLQGKFITSKILLRSPGPYKW